MQAVNVNEFAVKLRISETRPAAETFKDETRRYFEHLKGMTGKDIAFSDLVNHDNRVILVRGIAGIGKSVLTKQLAFLWANNEIYTQFKLVIILECREINSFAVNEGAALKRHEILSEFVKTKFKFQLGGGKAALIILDGLDELVDIHKKECVIWQLLDVRNSEYAMAKIILTGRPHIDGKLRKQGIDIGGLQRYEILGLDDEQIKVFVNKFTSCKEDIANINKAIDSSKKHLKFIAVPQMLNSYCVVIVLEGGLIHNEAELYVWVLYLLLKEHVEKEGPGQKLCSEIFLEYSSALEVLCKVCYELLSENRIIFLGNVKSQLLGSDKGTEFLQGLFVDVSDSRRKRFQFKHLTLMEFLSAVHICRMKNRMEIIANNLRNESYQLVFFICQLIGGCKYDGIIQDMFGNDEELKAINVQQFLPSVLQLVGQQRYQREQLFQLSIDIIMCFINKDVTNKKFIISTIKALRCVRYELDTGSMRKVSEICEHLIDEFECTEEDLKETFENVPVELVWIDDVKSLTCVKYLPNVKRIQFAGMETNALCIRNEVNAVAKGKVVKFYECELADDEMGNEAKEDHELELLWISGCRLNSNSFFHLCNWSLASRVKGVGLYHINNIKHSWWEYLANGISNQKTTESLALKELNIRGCTQMMSEEKQMKVRRYTTCFIVILSTNYSSL